MTDEQRERLGALVVEMSMSDDPNDQRAAGVLTAVVTMHGIPGYMAGMLAVVQEYVLRGVPVAEAPPPEYLNGPDLRRAFLSAYVEEPCRICGNLITQADIISAVFAGYSIDSAARAAHLDCWRAHIPQEYWKHP